VGNVRTNVCAKFRCAVLLIKKGIFRELIPTTRRTRTTRVAFWDPPSGSKKCEELCMETHLRATGCYLPYGITQCHTSQRGPPSPKPDKPVLDLPTLEGWKAELTWLVTYWDGLPVRRQSPIQVVTSNRAQRKATWLIATNALTTTPRRHLVVAVA